MGSIAGQEKGIDGINFGLLSSIKEVTFSVTLNGQIIELGNELSSEIGHRCI